MSYSTYSSTVATRFPGIAEAPSDWEARRLKFAVTYNDEILPDSTDLDFEITYVDIGSVDLIEGITATETLTFEEAPSRARRIVKDGDTIISTVRTYLKSITAIEDPPDNMIVSTGFAVIRPLEFVHRRYLGYALQGVGFVDRVVANSTGVSYPAINPTTLVTIPITYPDEFTEQKQIANFLDWKTGQIDSLIAKKKQLIAKLQEQRIAVITQAVTKGLNPDAPMRDSGIPWLGQVPEHWIVKRLRYCAGKVTSGSRGWAKYFSDQGSLFLRITNLHRDSIELKLEDLERVEPPEGTEGARTLTQLGDILISITADLGSVAVIPAECEPAYVSQHLALVRLDTNSIAPAWVAYSVFSDAGKSQLLTAGYGGTKVQLSLGDIKEISFSHPPTRDEQDTILEALGNRIENIDSLIRLGREAIACLTEYRTAIITAATTGKIDVRGVAVPGKSDD